MNNETIIIGCDMSAGMDRSVVMDAQRLQEGGIKIIDYKQVKSAIRGTMKTVVIEDLIAYEVFISNNYVPSPKKPRKPLPGYRQIEMRKRKY